MPCSLSLVRMLRCPASSETRIRRSLPTSSGVDVLVGGFGLGACAADVQARPCARRRSRRRRAAWVAGHQVGHLADVVGDLRQARELLVADAVDAHLQLEVGDDADQVGVAAALAVAVDRALHLRAPASTAASDVGHRQVGVVVGVDAERRRTAPRATARTASAIRAGQGAAVGVAEDEALGAGLGGGAQALERVRRVGAEAVEEVLGVEEDGRGPGPSGSGRSRAIMARFSSSVVSSTSRHLHARRSCRRW